MSTTPGRAAGSRFAVYRIAVALPEGSLGYVATHGRPELRAEIFSRLDVPDKDEMVLDVRIFNAGTDQLMEVARKVPVVRRAEIFPESDRSALYRLTIKIPLIWKVVRRHRILTRYPIVIVDGWARFETLTTPAQVRELVRDLRREVGPSRVEAVHQGSVNASALGLTDAQLAVFREALAAGYFASPRRISLTDLAHRLGRSKSTVSQQVALIQRRLAQSALRLQWTAMPLPG